MPSQIVSQRFGEQLRQTRRMRGLSQVELGGGRYSGSYISHLESGRRVASPEVVAFLAERLKVSPAELGLQSAASTTGMSTAVENLEWLVLAELAWHDRDWDAAVELAGRAAASAARSGHGESEWQAGYVRAQALFANGKFAVAAESAIELATHPIALNSATLRGEALALASTAYRSGDQLGNALATAARAVQVSEKAPPEVLADGLRALVAALSEGGASQEEIATQVARLGRLATEVESEHARGLIDWTLGTAAFRLGDPRRGMELHKRAAAQIRPQRDLRVWLRLQRTMANCRLDAGITENVAELLDVARRGFSLVGNPVDVGELTLSQAKLMLTEGHADAAVELVDSMIARSPAEVVALLEGEAQLVRADALAALNRRQEARDAYRRAATVFDGHGAWRLGSRAWRRAADLSVSANGSSQEN